MTQTAAVTMSAQQRTLLRVLTVATFVVILNETIMINAIPLLMGELRISARSAQWLSSGFMLTMAVVIPVTGWFLQRVTTRAAFATAMALFCGGTLVAGLAPAFPTLVAARVIQAAGTAVMLPLLMTTLLNVVPPAQRGRVMGNVTLTISVAPALGPALSGVILQFLPWRWLFFLVLPVAAALALGGLRVMRSTGQPQASRLDLPSVLLTAVGFGGLVYGLSQLGPATPHAAVSPWTVLAVGAFGLVVFVARQLWLQRTATPLLDLRTLTHGGYVNALAIMALGFMALMGAMILLPMYLQQVRGLSTLATGLLLMPGGLAMGLLGPPVGRRYDRLGARPLVVPGTVGLVAALTLMGLAAAAGGPAWWFLPLHMLLSVSLALVFTPVFAAGLAFLPQSLYSHGSAMLGTLQQVAAAAGTALMVTVMSTRAAQLAGQGDAQDVAMSGGVQAALAVAAVIAAAALGLSFRQQTPTQEAGGPVASDASDTPMEEFERDLAGQDGSSRTTQRNPRCPVEVSTDCGCRADGL
jgi:MFS transporter, DHA2 family, lincomycin resistance protein